LKTSNKKAFSYITILLIILIPMLIYLLVPSSFWNSIGSKTFKGPVIIPQDNSGGPTPTSLRFNNPFQYDNYKPSKRDEFMKKREENSKDKDGKTIFWSR